MICTRMVSDAPFGLKMCRRPATLLVVDRYGGEQPRCAMEHLSHPQRLAVERGESIVKAITHRPQELKP